RPPCRARRPAIGPAPCSTSWPRVRRPGCRPDSQSTQNWPESCTTYGAVAPTRGVGWQRLLLALTPSADEGGILPAALAIGEGPTREVQHRAAGCFQHRLRPGAVPFHRATEARVEVRRALCNATEFQPGADIADRGDLAPGEKAVQPGVIGVIAACHHHEPARRRDAGMDGPLARSGAFPRAVAHDTAEHLAKRGHADHPQ